jgi:transglutaminase-like putative cysteine protease
MEATVRYRITHRTEYTYTTPAHESFNEVRLRPVSDEMQTCLDFNLAIDPPATVIAFQDYYGNAVHDFGIPYLHDHLCIEATSDVVTFAAVDQPLAGPVSVDEDRSPLLANLVEDFAFADEYAEFLTPSAYVALEAASGALTQSLLVTDLDTTAYAFLLAAAAYVHEHFDYRVGATTVHSTVADVLAGGSGVCQDFSHLLISMCRHVGLPARYVSGYLGDVPESPASHAWVEACVPPYGWIGVDPTAGAPCTGRHVKVAIGRDYADVSVVRGTYRGGAASDLAVIVRSEVVGDARGLVVAGGRGRGELIQYQTLGAMKQLQRLGAMAQSLQTMTQTMGTMRQSLGGLPRGMPNPYAEEDIPRQQPQQQQQSMGLRR